MNRVNKMSLVFGLLCSTLVQAQMYKWVEADGTVKYSDKPPPASVKAVNTIGKKRTSVEGEATAPAPTPIAEGAPLDKAGSPEDMSKKRREVEEKEKKLKEAKAEEQKRKELNCRSAKANYGMYAQGGRVFTTDENGERVYLDEQQLKERAENAQREIQENCN